MGKQTNIKSRGRNLPSGKRKKARKPTKGKKVDRRTLHIHKAVNDTFNRLYFTGSSTTRGVRPHNLKRLCGLLKPVDATIAEGLIQDKLRNEEITWYVWIGVFVESEREIGCVPFLGEANECTVKDFDRLVNPLIKDAIEAVEANGDTPKGYGWIASPTYTCDLGASEEELIEFFMNQDVTNEQKRKEIFKEYQEKISIEKTTDDDATKLIPDVERITRIASKTSDVSADVLASL